MVKGEIQGKRQAWAQTQDVSPQGIMCRYLLFSLPRSRQANRRGYWACAREGYRQLETPACPPPEDHHGPQEPLRSSEKPSQGGTSGR